MRKTSCYHRFIYSENIDPKGKLLVYNRVQKNVKTKNKFKHSLDLS